MVPTNQKPLDRHVRDMVNTITNRVSGIPTGGPRTSTAAADDEDEQQQQQQGVRVVTLAGTNTGATMRGNLDDDQDNRNARRHRQYYYSSLNKGKNKSDETNDDLNDEVAEEEEEEGVGTYVNSNFQAVNNSIMLDSNYSTNDPGVHMDISDHHHVPPRGGSRLGVRRGKKSVVDHDAGDERFRSHRHQRHSDDDHDDSSY